MAFGQLYYTSCERGLSGYQGYQFNAATPGVGADVMRRVEQLTAYEPPPSLGYHPTAAQIAACPVNLCFAPAGPGGADPAVLARVVFAGADYSNRFGNYFAHALVADSADDLGDLFAVDLWRAPFWVREPSPTTELPTLRGPLATGPMSRRSVERFLAEHAHARHLARLLSATELAIARGERSVLLVETVDDRAAHWIAALSYLLPPPLARRMSFATYHHRPTHSQLHVVGTVPEAATELGAEAAESFYLFDFTAEQFSTVDIHPLAEVLARTGPLAAERIWPVAVDLAGATDQAGFAGWYAPAVAAAALSGQPPDAEGLAALMDWLPGAARRIGPGPVREVSLAVLGLPGLADRYLRPLADCAGAVGDGDLLGTVERRIVDAEVAAVTDGRETNPAAAPVSSPAARAYAAEVSTGLLRRSDPATALALLGWAAQARVDIAADDLYAWARHTLGGLALRRPGDENLRRILTAWQPTRAGVIEYLAEAAGTDAPAVLAAFDGGLSSVLDPRELADHPHLGTVLRVGGARDDPRRRIAVLADLLRTGHDLSEPGAGLANLWPQGYWTPAAALEVVRALPEKHAATGEVARWLSGTLLRPLPPDDGKERERAAYQRLCDGLARDPVRGTLSEAAQDALSRVERAGGTVRGQRAVPRRGDAAQAVAAIGALAAGAPPPVFTCLAGFARLVLAEAPTPEFGPALANCPPSIVDDYLAHLPPELALARPDPRLAARVFGAARSLRRNRRTRLAAALDAVVADHLPGWRKRDLDAVAQVLDREDPRGAADFERWRKEHGRGSGRRGLALPGWRRRGSDR